MMYSVALVYLALLVAQVWGWVGNLIQTFHAANVTPIGADFLLGIVGIFLPPVGAIKYFFF
jgi:hypothetical protein